MTHEIKVLQHHIDEGIMGDTEHCPVALAIREQVKSGAGKVVACGEFVMIGNDRYRLPEEATDFMIDFDREVPVRPFTFTIERSPVRPCTGGGIV